jgi:hypothetical protein
MTGRNEIHTRVHSEILISAVLNNTDQQTNDDERNYARSSQNRKAFSEQQIVLNI